MAPHPHTIQHMMSTPMLRFPDISDGRTSRMQSSHSHGKMENRFTKLKGVLVNNLLKEYHKQTKQQGDQAVYNHAVTEVEKILAHNTRLTEQQLQELQRNFASGVMIKVPDRNIHVQQHTTKKLTYNPKSAKNLAMSRAMTGDQNPNAFDSTEPKVSQAMQTELRETTGYTVANSGEETIPSHAEGAESKRQRRVDEWSILVLHNDVQHLEEQKKTKERQAIEKQKIREELLQQVQVKEDLKKKQKEEVTKIARQQQEEYSKWKAEQERVAQIKQAKILKEKEYEAKELERVQKVKQVQAEKDFKEQKAMLAEFSRQIAEEKSAKEIEQQVKAAAYQEMLKGNAKVLERKKELKEADRQENLRLFQLQIEMAEKQERMRAAREEERQQRLKKAERMAGEMGVRAAEQEAELDQRIKKAQEEARVRDQERDREKRDKKKLRDEETARVLAIQVQKLCDQRDADRADRAIVAQQYRSDAEALVRAEAAARMAKVESKKAVQEELNKQLALKSMNKAQFHGMSNTELRLNKALLQKVLDEKAATSVPEDFVERMRDTPVMKHNQSVSNSTLKTPREIR